MSRFFVAEKNISADAITINEKEDVKHLTKVLRHKEGDVIEISDGKQFEYEIEIETLTNDFVSGKILSKQEFSREPKTRILLYQGLPKQGKMDVIIQKSVELGVETIIPMITERTVVIDKGNFTKKTERWQKISDEAAKQCRRGVIPHVYEPQHLATVLSSIQNNELNLFFYEEEKETTLKATLQRLIASSEIEKIGMFIGPEGGFSDQEAKRITAAGAIPVSLGKTILRVETAAIAAISMVLYEMER